MFQPGNAIRIGIDISLDKTPNENIINMFDHLAIQEIQLSIVNNKIKYILYINIHFIKIVYFFILTGV